MKKPYIVYSLSKDRTTQKFNKSKINDIVDGLQSFLSKYTKEDARNPDSIEITVCNDEKNSQYDILDRTIQHFGSKREVSPIGYQYPSGIPHTTLRHVWTLNADKFEDALQFIISNKSLPKSDHGPIELFTTYSFKLHNPITKVELPNQENTSIFCIWLSKSSKSISPTIFFPFEIPDENFWSYLDKISLYLPFKIEEKYLRITHVNKKGEINSFKKIVRPILNNILKLCNSLLRLCSMIWFTPAVITVTIFVTAFVAAGSPVTSALVTIAVAVAFAGRHFYQGWVA